MTSPIADIEGKYEILAKLSEGGMGAIYQVRHRLLDEVRVVKVLRQQHAEDDELRRRFAHEARAAIRLRHPNVVQIFDFSVDEEGNGLIVMEHIEGVDFEKLVKSRRAPSMALGLELARQSLRSLGFLHRHGFVHRDVSPDNLMLTLDVDGRPLVKLIDLGIAKRVDAEHQLTARGSFLGKFRYASPEHFGAAGHDGIEARSDLYSFGVVLYELLTQRFPMQAETTSQLITAHLMRAPRSFEETDPEGRLPDGVREMVMRALAKEPQDRYADAEEWVRYIEDLQRDADADGDVTAEARTWLAEVPQEEKERPGGSTQGRLDRVFGLETTPKPERPLGPESPPAPARELDALVKGARTLFELGQTEAARHQVETLLTIEPDHPDATRLLDELDTPEESTEGSVGEGEQKAEDDAPEETAEEKAEEPEEEEAAAEAEAEEKEATAEEAEPEGERGEETAAAEEEDDEDEEAEEAEEGDEAGEEDEEDEERETAEELEDEADEADEPLEEEIEVVESLIAEHQLTEADRHLFQLAEVYGDSKCLDSLRRRLEDAFGGDLESQLQSLLQEAEERVEADEYSAALDLIRKAEIMVPEEGDVRRRCMEGIEELEEEIETRERRRGLEELEAHVERSLRAGELEGLESELEQAMTTYGAAGDTAVGRLEELLDRVRRTRSDRLSHLVSEAGVALEDGRFRAAVESLRQALELDPENRWIARQLETAEERLEEERRRGEADASRVSRLITEADESEETGAGTADLPPNLVMTLAEIEQLRQGGAHIAAWKLMQQAFERFGELEVLLEARQSLANAILEKE